MPLFRKKRPKKAKKLTRAEASRLNGARSKGPVTAQGKARSSLNSLKTGLYAAPCVPATAAGRSRFQAEFDRLLARQPDATEAERQILHRLAAARARRDHIWMMQFSLGDRLIARSGSGPRSEESLMATLSRMAARAEEDVLAVLQQMVEMRISSFAPERSRQHTHSMELASRMGPENPQERT